MRLSTRFLPVFLLLVWPTIGTTADEPRRAPANDHSLKESSAKSSDDEKFIRIRRDADGRPLALETAIVTYASTDETRPDLVVELIGAVHVGEKSYYEQLNQAFTAYDALLYELVAPEDKRVPTGDKERAGRHPVTAMQTGLKSILELEFQLDQIDYTKDNFIHADMSPQEFAQTMESRGESFVQMFFRMLGASAAQQGNPNYNTSNAALLMALFSKDRSVRMKQAMAEQLADVDANVVVFGGKDGSTIITERNKKALEVLDEQIGAGKKRIGIFYGAAHLPDFERRLIEERNLRRKDVRWLPAWYLQPEAPPQQNIEGGADKR